MAKGDDHMNATTSWDADWAWSIPLIALTVMFHVTGLGLFNVRADRILSGVRHPGHYDFTFVLVMGVTTIWATFLHAVEAGVWAVAYRTLGALPDSKSALLYSLSAMTAYGHAQLFLESRWQLMGALEALNGLMLFGLTTAFIYGMIQRVWPIERRGGYRG
jgi:hypothetical protein